MNAASSSSEASSSSHSPPNHDHSAQAHDESDAADILGSPSPTHPRDGADDGDILGDDPLRDDLDRPFSFKRKLKPSILSQPARLFTALTGRRSPSPGPDAPRWSPQRDTSPERLWPDGPAPGRGGNINSKDGVPLDWYVEGPGRRVGYEDLTAIDWIFEYTKERQRLRMLYSSATGLLGYVRQLLDASQVWVILVLTGLAVGAIAAGIDVATNWLGDLKGGYCTNTDGGAFYLNRAFCCLGYDDFSQCGKWRPWGTALGITSVGGKWFMEYFFFSLFSVR
jgi:chloride channel 3/4/5